MPPSPGDVADSLAVFEAAMAQLRRKFGVVFWVPGTLALTLTLTLTLTFTLTLTLTLTLTPRGRVRGRFCPCNAPCDHAPSPLQVAKDLPSDAEICRRAATAEHWRSYKAGLVTGVIDTKRARRWS